MLERIGQMRFATDGAAALRLMRDRVPDLVLLDAELPGLSGPKLCAMISRARPPVHARVGDTDNCLSKASVGGVSKSLTPQRHACDHIARLDADGGRSTTPLVALDDAGNGFVAWTQTFGYARLLVSRLQ